MDESARKLGEIGTETYYDQHVIVVVCVVDCPCKFDKTFASHGVLWKYTSSDIRNCNLNCSKIIIFFYTVMSL